MLAALNTKEVGIKYSKQKYDDIPNFKIGDLAMIRNFDKNLTWMQSMYITSELCA